MFLSKKTKIDCVEITIILLAGYHACPLDNPDFRVKYKHLFSMLNTMKGSKNVR